MFSDFNYNTYLYLFFSLQQHFHILNLTILFLYMKDIIEGFVHISFAWFCYYTLYVTMEHKTSHKGPFFEIEIYA